MDRRILELLNDVLEVFGDTGSGKSKFVHALALEALNSGKKVFFLDTEKNLSSADIARLNGAYRYTPVFDEIKKTTQNLPAVDLCNNRQRWPSHPH